MEEAKAADLMSEDMRRELLRQKWEKEEEENLQKRNVHYQVRSKRQISNHLVYFFNIAYSIVQLSTFTEVTLNKYVSDLLRGFVAHKQPPICQCSVVVVHEGKELV